MEYQLTSDFEPTGDQPNAIKQLVKGVENGEEGYLANATVYLEMFGVLVMGWVWLNQAMVAKEQLLGKKPKKADLLFYEGKIKVAEYYFANELPKIYSLSRILTRQVPVTLFTSAEHFTN